MNIIAIKNKLTGGNLLQTIVQTSASNFMIIIFTTLASILTARMFGVSGRGELTAILYWSQFLTGLVSFGLPTSLIYNVKNNKEQPASYIKLCFMFQIPVTFILGLIVWINIPQWMIGYPIEIIQTAKWYTILNIPLLLMTSVIAAMAQSLNRFHVYNLLRLAVPVLNLLALLLLWVTGSLQISAAAYSYVLINFLIVMWALVQLRSSLHIQWFRRFHPKRVAKNLFGYGIRVYGVELTGNIYNQFDKLIILSFLTAKELGLYTVVYSLSRLFNVVQSAITNVVFPKVTGMDRDEIIKVVGSAFRLSLLAMSVLIIPAMIIGKFLLGLLFGAEFLEASTAFYILCVECVLGGGSWILTTSFNAIGRPGLVLIRQLIALAITIALMFLLIPLFGLEGVALALLGGGLVRMIFSMVAASILFKVPFYKILYSKDDFVLVKNRILRKKLTQ